VKTRGVIGAMLLCVLSSAGAQGTNEWGGALGLTSDYVLRGLSQTRGKPAVQADLHWTHDSRLSLGAWGSTIDLNPGPGPTLELNLYAALTQPFADDWAARVVATHYVYPNDTPGRRWDYDELAASLSFRDRLVATVTWSPNLSGFGAGRYESDRTALAYELTAMVPWRQAWTFSAGAGYYDVDNLFYRGYGYWSAGATYAQQSWQVNLARMGTSSAAREMFGAEVADDRWSVDVQWRVQGPAF
jgi:uncharacterized protein (TIGR02001 family)